MCSHLECVFDVFRLVAIQSINNCILDQTLHSKKELPNIYETNIYFIYIKCKAAGMLLGVLHVLLHKWLFLNKVLQIGFNTIISKLTRSLE